jgi:hypothetical protein
VADRRAEAAVVRLTARGKPRKRNPAPGDALVVRLQPHELAMLDNWMIEQHDIPENRQAAVRRMIAMVCERMEGK